MKLSLAQKIIGGFGVLLALIVLLGWVTLSLFNSLRAVQSRVFDEAIPGVVAVNGIVRGYTAQSAAVRGYLISSQPKLLDQYQQEVNAASYWERRGENLFTAAREEQLLDEIISAGRDYRRVVENKVVPAAQRGQRSLAFSVLVREGDPLVSRIEDRGLELRRLQNTAVVASEDDLRLRNAQTLVTLAFVTLGVLLVGILLTILLPRRLGTNLSQLVQAARGMERGDLDQRIDVRSGDEIEELAIRMEEMQAGLRRLQQLAAQDRELEIAASIQQNLLQRTLPQAPGAVVIPVQRQANLVGGDWYDVHSSGPNLTIVVGDASGKGIGAALMGAVTLSVLRAERRLGADSKRIIQRANDALREATDPDSFTTLVYATLELNEGQVRWMNMGHPSPFLLRAAPDSPKPNGFFLEGPRNRALGWFDDPGLAETVARLDPGDRLVFYTDGFIEAKSPDGEVYGDERFAKELLDRAELSSGDLGEALVRAVERFAAGKLDDDLTMLIVEFQGAPLREGVTERLTGEEPWHSRR